MTLITIDGQTGAGAPELGKIVAEKLGIDFIDRLVLSQIARRLGSVSVQRLDEYETRVPTFIDRITANIEAILARSSISGMGGDPYFGPGVEHLLSKPYHELDDPKVFSRGRFDEKKFIAATKEVIMDVAQVGNVIIIGRGGSIVTKSIPGVLSICLTAEIDHRKTRLIKSEGISAESALDIISHADHAQETFFSRAFNESPTNPLLYHLMYNTTKIGIEEIADYIIMMVKMPLSKKK